MFLVNWPPYRTVPKSPIVKRYQESINSNRHNYTTHVARFRTSLQRISHIQFINKRKTLIVDSLHVHLLHARVRGRLRGRARSGRDVGVAGVSRLAGVGLSVNPVGSVVHKVAGGEAKGNVVAGVGSRDAKITLLVADLVGALLVLEEKRDGGLGTGSLGTGGLAMDLSGMEPGLLLDDSGVGYGLLVCRVRGWRAHITYSGTCGGAGRRCRIRGRPSHGR